MKKRGKGDNLQFENENLSTKEKKKEKKERRKEGSKERKNE